MLAAIASLIKRALQPVLVRAASRRRTHLSGTRFVGITGSCGKTTTKELLADCLSRQGSCTKNRGSDNSLWSLAKTIAYTSSRHRFAVMEVGTQKRGGTKPKAKLLQPEVVIITCIALAHTEGLDSLDGIASEKSELLCGLAKGGSGILSKDEPYFDYLRSRIPDHARCVTVSMKEEAAFVGCVGDPAEGRFEIRDTADNSRHLIKLPIPGRAQMINSLFAAAAARVLGVAWSNIESALQEFRGLPLRWQKSEYKGITIINDAYNANPASMQMALETFAGMQVKGRKWLVLGGMRELGEREMDEHIALGRAVAKEEWAGLLAVGTWGAVIADAAREAGFPAERVEICENPEAAASLLLQCAASGDAVLIKASRFYELERVEESLRRQMQ